MENKVYVIISEWETESSGRETEIFGVFQTPESANEAFNRYIETAKTDSIWLGGTEFEEFMESECFWYAQATDNSVWCSCRIECHINQK